MKAPCVWDPKSKTEGEAATRGSALASKPRMWARVSPVCVTPLPICFFLFSEEEMEPTPEAPPSSNCLWPYKPRVLTRPRKFPFLAEGTGGCLWSRRNDSTGHQKAGPEGEPHCDRFLYRPPLLGVNHDKQTQVPHISHPPKHTSKKQEPFQNLWLEQVENLIPK